MERPINKIFSSLYDIAGGPFEKLISATAEYLPILLAALTLFLIGRLIAKVLERMVSSALAVGSVQNLIDKVGLTEVLGFVGIRKPASIVAGKVVYWVVILFFATSAFEVMGLEMIVSTLQDFISFLPNIFLASVVMVIAFAVSRLAKNAVLSSLQSLDVTFGDVLATLAQIIVIYFGTIVAAEKLNFNVDVISANASYVIIGIIAIIVVSLCFGTRIPATNLIASYYVKQLHKVGDNVTLAGLKGEIVAINNIAVVLNTESGQKHIPNRIVLESGSVAEKR